MATANGTRPPANERDRRAASAETDWQQTFDAVSDPMAILTPDYRVVRANAAYLAWRQSDRGRCEGHQCFVHNHRQAGPCEQCPLPRVLRTGQPGFVRQVQMQYDGPSDTAVAHTYETWTYPVKNASGAVERVVEIVKDVTERERLRQMTSEAETLRQADRLKTELLGTVSHELRSPLASIMGYAATLLKHEKRLSGPERHEFLQAIVDASERLEDVIERMLDMSRLETGLVRMAWASVDVERLAREAASEAERQAMERSPGMFTFRVDARIPAGTADALIVAGDRNRLRDVLDQLLGNAVKYSPEGGSITVVVRPVTPCAPYAAAERVELSQLSGQDRNPTSRPMVELVVCDNGIGIPSEQLDLVFERFHRLDTRLTREAEGLGLGLAIVKRVVELHGGTIWAESARAGGSAFHVLLPIERTAGIMANPNEATDSATRDQIPPRVIGAGNVVEGAGRKPSGCGGVDSTANQGSRT